MFVERKPADELAQRQRTVFVERRPADERAQNAAADDGGEAGEPGA